MSPSDAAARTRTAAQGTVVTDAQLADQIRALVAGEQATSDPRTTRRRRYEEESPRTPFEQGHEAAQQASGPNCWTFGTRGHRTHECPQDRRGADKGIRQSSDDGLGARIDRLEKLMEQMSKKLLAKNA